jgi:uncharacterized protein (DUF488 family)
VSKLFTIGFTKKTAKEFFHRLQKAQVRRILDIRLNNSSQLSGFAKQQDLVYFLKEIGNIDYIHLPQLCPTDQILEAYKKHMINWHEYEDKFKILMKERRVENSLDMELLDYGCLLCSEDKPDHCHRRLVGEYLYSRMGGIEIVHL